MHCSYFYSCYYYVNADCIAAKVHLFVLLLLLYSWSTGWLVGVYAFDTKNMLIGVDIRNASRHFFFFLISLNFKTRRQQSVQWQFDRLFCLCSCAAAAVSFARSDRFADTREQHLQKCTAQGVISNGWLCTGARIV